MYKWLLGPSTARSITIAAAAIKTATTTTTTTATTTATITATVVVSYEVVSILSEAKPDGEKVMKV